MKKLILTLIPAIFLSIIFAFLMKLDFYEKSYNRAEDEIYILNYEIEELEKTIENLMLTQAETELPAETTTAPLQGIKIESTAETEIKTEIPMNIQSQVENSSDVSEITAGKVETERKFLLDVNNLPVDSMKIAATYDFTQTYINYSPEIRVRARTGHKNDFYMTIKTPLDTAGLSRQEIEFFISSDEYAELIKKQVGDIIYKTRYQFWVENHYISIDVYSGDLIGLAVAEVEFNNIEDANAYIPPEWFGAEITTDSRYKNANLSRNGMPE